MSVRIRRAGPADAASVAVVASATFLETFADELLGADVVTRCAEALTAQHYGEVIADRNAAVWLAELETTGSPVGFAVLKLPDLPTVETKDGDIQLKQIYLLGRFHGKRIGAALMNAAIEFAQQRGKTRLLLGVYARNQHAIDFYARNDFVRIGDQQFKVGNGCYDDIIFAREVTANVDEA